jgi:methylthioribose-1-phosphate isomerase
VRGNKKLMTVELTGSRLDVGYLPLKLAGGKLLILDQRALPETIKYFECTHFQDSCLAIKDMIVRGAPSIGVTAAFAFALEAGLAALSTTSTIADNVSYDQLFIIPDEIGRQKLSVSNKLNERFEQIKNQLNATRPTAVNLRWGTERMHSYCLNILDEKLTVNDFIQLALDEAQTILDEHIQCNITLSDYGAEVVPKNANIITHCNAGPLATCGWGTALGVIRTAHNRGLNPHVYVDETRPRNQGAKLTMWELTEDKIPATLVCDNMSGFLMANKKIDLVIVGADRITREGDAANKIGTYNLAIVARHHDVPFYVAAPLSTFDATISHGREIPIEERDATEITGSEDSFQTVKNARVFNPSFDVTPSELIAGIITEAGILRKPYAATIKDALGIK